MAQKRMFSLQIVDTDAFLEMPTSTQNLYFHLCMRADDDGFISNPKKIIKIVNCSIDDMKILFSKRFILGFDNGIIVIKHWKIHNYIAIDRYKETVYTKEKNSLFIKENGSYTDRIQTCIQNVDSDKVSIDKVSIDKKQKKAYADNVKMTEKEYKKLLDKYGDIQTNRLIQYLSDYKKEKGYKTKSDYLTILRWVVDAAKVKEIPEEEKIIISQPAPENNYLDQLRESASDEQNDIKF